MKLEDVEDSNYSCKHVANMITESYCVSVNCAAVFRLLGASIFHFLLTSICAGPM